MIKAVILDFDDTLVLTEEICFNLENDVLFKIGQPKMERAAHIETWGQPLFEAIKTRSSGVNIKEFEKIYSKVIKEYIDQGIFDNIPEENFETLRQIEAQGKYLAILTMRTKNELDHILDKKHLLSSLVKEFFYQENMAYRKPDPRVFDELMKSNQLSPSECVYVGDSLHDAQAARGAGIKFIASLESGLRKKSDFKGLKVACFIKKFPELLGALKFLDDNTN